MPALEVLSGFATAPGAAFVGLTMGAGDTLTIRNTLDEMSPRLLTTWQDKQAVGNFRIRSPRLHDVVQGINMANVISDLSPSMPIGFPQPLVSQDVLIAEITGSAVAGDIESASLLVYYPDLPGIDANLIDTMELRNRLVNLMTSQNTLALGAAGGYSGAQAINATVDLMKANTDYALIGYNVRGECATVRWKGADVGNLGVGGPGTVATRFYSAYWFAWLSDAFGLPLIPVFNSANKAGIIIDGVQDENAGAAIVTSIFAELKH